ncbi:uncharacterized protein LOC126745134 isoform X2 [Anthonomus grandis grandis]|uniref:uncharacterized protein LOC126745134 isoform X2 n=1 Tax=Anthonomus grandis grandis TaxID=2921223 RepID=UPI002166B5A6|nr:uncharacterized protein LOC126745134 isoform X2 [Anthonomus grandis grandis]
MAKPVVILVTLTALVASLSLSDAGPTTVAKRAINGAHPLTDDILSTSDDNRNHELKRAKRYGSRGRREVTSATDSSSTVANSTEATANKTEASQDGASAASDHVTDALNTTKKLDDVTTSTTQTDTENNTESVQSSEASSSNEEQPEDEQYVFPTFIVDPFKALTQLGDIFKLMVDRAAQVVDTIASIGSVFNARHENEGDGDNAIFVTDS